MSDTEKLIELAVSQLGTAESPPGSNNVIYNTEYYGHEVYGDAYPWCCVFIWWLFRHTGLSDLFCGGQMTAYCPFAVNWARNNGKWITGGYRTGDIVFFDWDGDGAADHIGITERVSGKVVTTIEGNCENAVKRAARGESGIMGAYRPDYKEDVKPGPEPEPEPEPAGMTYIVRSGDTLWGLAERFLGDPWRYREIMELNGLVGDMIYPGQELKIPGGPGPERVTMTIEVSASTYLTLLHMAEASGKSAGEWLDELLKEEQE